MFDDVKHVLMLQQEAKTGEVNLEDDEPDIIAHMLEFMYTGHYDDGRVPLATDEDEDNGSLSQLESETESQQDGHEVVQADAEATELEEEEEDGSESVTVDDLVEAVPLTALLTNAKVYVIGDKYNIQPLKELVKRKYAEVVPYEWNDASFAASLQFLYENTPESDRLLKDVAIRTAAQHAKELIDHGEFVDLFRNCKGIAFDVLKQALLPKRDLNSTGMRCPFCNSAIIHFSPMREEEAWFCHDCKERW